MNMHTMISSIGLPLQWQQPDLFKMEFELTSGDALFAALRFRSSWGTYATSESADGCWTFKRVGFFSTHVSIRPCNSEEEIATFKNNTWTGGGTLLFPDGREFPANTNFWMTQFEFKTQSGESLVHYQSGGFVRPSAQVTIQAAAGQIPELSLIVMLGWYLIIMMHNDSAAAV
jgi:hypothetical protein